MRGHQPLRPTKAVSKLNRSSVAALAMLAVLGISGCKPGSELRIGYAASLSGKDYMLGVDGRNAAELFVHQVNATGGLKGQKLSLVIEDLGSKPENVEPAITRLINQDVVCILGPYTSGEVESALGLVNRAKLPMLSPAATADSLSGLDDYFFRTIMSSKNDGPALIAHMKEQGYTSVFLITSRQNQTYISTYTAPMYQAMKVSGELSYSSIQEARASLESGLADSDCVLIVASSIDTGTIAQLVRQVKPGIPLYGSGWAGNQDLIQYGGNAVEGMVFVHQINAELDTVKEFAEDFRKVYGTEPGFGAIETWDTLLLLQSAFLNQRPKELLHQTLRRISQYMGISAHITLDNFGDAQRALYLKTIRNGKITLIATLD